MRPFFAVLLLFSVQLLHAQSGNYITVIQVNGQVKWLAPPDKKELYLVPGLISLESTLILPEGTSVHFILDDRAIALATPGRFVVRDFVKASGNSQPGVFSRLFRFLNEGVTHTGNTEVLEEYHKQYITKVSGGIKGFAGGEFGILASSPVTGRIDMNTTVQFSWYAEGDSILYDFSMRDFQSDGIVFKAMLKDTALVIPFGMLALEEGRKYYWIVEKRRLGEFSPMFSLTDDPGLRSPKVEFIPENMTDAEVLAELEKSPEYTTQSDEVTRRMLKALFFEEKQRQYAAYETYRAAQRDFPDHAVVRQLFAAFQVRQGLLQAGRDLIQD